ncbi:MAG TPA: NADH-ubiquinone oxidoreductase-F iron-sulfur binding region domain-containing protein [Trebonia sp.]|nr:NADH-ubiquinone oxidoreductase-F iron-sulfur binding region domain-containing protein [Trebonia sp.]
MPALTTGVHPAVRPRLLREQDGREDRAAYEAAGGYQPGLAGTSLIDAVAASGLRGRGGGAFPAARKLAAVASRPGPKVVVVNGEEGEPASVKDRWLLRSRPHLVIDGALRAAQAVGAGTVYFYVSDAAAAISLEAALAELDGAPCDLRVHRVDAGYVAGEETAAVNAINGRPAKPSEKPPRPFEAGVGGQPTLVGNAETIATLPAIASGTTGQARSFLLTLSGAVPRPGLYEVPFGIPLGEATEVLGRLAGSARGYLMGGYFAGMLNARGHDLPLDYDALRAQGSGLGCGAVTVLGADDCPVGAAALLLAYFGRENAGQCGSCFNGTAAMAGVAIALARGEAGPAEIARLAHWSGFLPGRGACATLDGAAGVAATLLREFPGEVQAHQERSCAACAATDFLATSRPFALTPDSITPPVEAAL